MIATEFVKGTGCARTAEYCTVCESRGVPHAVVREDAGPAKNWGGVPSHRRRCTGCGFTDGPWVDADAVGGGY